MVIRNEIGPPARTAVSRLRPRWDLPGDVRHRRAA